MKINNFYRIKRYFHILYIKNLFLVRDNINNIKIKEQFIYSRYILNKIKQNEIKK
mgnify:CR=1 FL=1